VAHPEVSGSTCVSSVGLKCASTGSSAKRCFMVSKASRCILPQTNWVSFLVRSTRGLYNIGVLLNKAAVVVYKAKERSNALQCLWRLLFLDGFHLVRIHTDSSSYLNNVTKIFRYLSLKLALRDIQSKSISNKPAESILNLLSMIL
jgi:hypothetical protein